MPIKDGMIVAKEGKSLVFAIRKQDQRSARAIKNDTHDAVCGWTQTSSTASNLMRSSVPGSQSSLSVPVVTIL